MPEPFYFKSGEELLDRLRARQPETMPGLIILDVQTPGPACNDLVQQIRQMDVPGSCTIAVYSTSISNSLKEELIKRGVALCLQKGKTLPEMQADMEQFCSLAKKKQDHARQ